MSDLDAFLAGRAPDNVAIVLSDDVLSNPAALDEYAEPLEGGLALILPGTTGRSAFQQATGQDPMAFARAAGEREGRIDRDLSGGACPEADGSPGEAHRPTILFAFAEARNEELGGLYAEGPVVHAYAHCSCGTRYSDRWTVGD